MTCWSRGYMWCNLISEMTITSQIATWQACGYRWPLNGLWRVNHVANSDVFTTWEPFLYLPSSLPLPFTVSFFFVSSSSFHQTHFPFKFLQPISLLQASDPFWNWKFKGKYFYYFNLNPFLFNIYEFYFNYCIFFLRNS